MDIKPFKHQVETFERFKDADYGAILLEPGLGKTKVAIDIIEHKYRAGQISAALIVTTKSLMLNWARVEIPKHQSLAAGTWVWGGREAPGVKADRLDYLILNIDALNTEKFVPWMREVLKLWPRFALVVDESTVIKTPTAKRTKMLLKVARKAAARFIMTGTPVTNSPLDLWSQCEVLEPGVLGYSNYYSFKWDHTVTQTQFFGNRSFQKVVAYKNLDRLKETLGRFAVIRKARDCLDLPPRRYRRIPVEFTKEQEKAYNELKAMALTMVRGHQVTAVNAVSLINRLLQICAGQLKVSDTEYISIPTRRLDLLRELVDETGKVIVWSSFVRSAEDIVRTLGDDAVHLESGLSITKRQAVVDRFRQTDVKALVANPASSGHGITLIEAANVIYYSNSWSLEHRVQSEFRTDRIGQTQSVLYTDLYVPGTVEEYVLDLLTTKRDRADEFMREALTDPARLVKEAVGG